MKLRIVAFGIAKEILKGKHHEMELEDDRDALLDHLDLLLLGGRMTADLRLEVNKLMDSRDYKNAASQRVAEAIFLIASSPEAAIQR